MSLNSAYLVSNSEDQSQDVVTDRITSGLCLAILPRLAYMAGCGCFKSLDLRGAGRELSSLEQSRSRSGEFYRPSLCSVFFGATGKLFAHILL